MLLLRFSVELDRVELQINPVNIFKTQSTYLPALETTHTQIHDMLPHAHNNEIFIILTPDFSKEQYVFPDDDMRYAIETCRSILNVLVKIILD